MPGLKKAESNDKQQGGHMQVTGQSLFALITPYNTLINVPGWLTLNTGTGERITVTPNYDEAFTLAESYGARVIHGTVKDRLGGRFELTQWEEVVNSAP